MISLPEHAKIIGVSPPKDYSSAAATTEYINIGKYRKVGFLISTGAWAGGNAAVTLKQAINKSGSSSSSAAISEYWTNDGSTSSDTLTKTTAASSTFNLDTASAQYYVEVDAADLSINSSMDYVAIAVASPGANSDFYNIVALAFDPRYAGASPPSAIT
jgi:hypothetical protein